MSATTPESFNSAAARAARRVQCVAGHVQAGEQGLVAVQGVSATEMVDGVTTLRAERAGGSFDVRAMTRLLDGGEEITRIKEEYVALLEREPLMLDAGFYDRTREQARYRVMQKMKRFGELKPEDPLRSKIFNDLVSLHDASFSTRMGVHYTLFIGALTGQATKELQEKYVPDARKLRVIGSFSMTEMGHGSAIRHFETTAHFDKQSDTFVINTPTLTATKWWIGGAAHISTHTICFARLIIDEKDYGVHSFLVQLRDRDGNILPGITIGDCGKKMGRDGIDNGWLQFNNVRVPRSQMLQKWAKVSREGVYSQPPKAQLAYGALLGGRVSLILNCNDQLKRGLTVAIRYCAVRRQFANKPGAPETQILDYQTHQIRLLEPLCGAFAWTFAGRTMEAQATKLQQDLANGDLTNLPDLHATSAGLKAICTWYITAALEQARQCMAGHGYSAYSALPTLVADITVNCTWEGDNTVMLLQTAQYLVKSISRVFEGKKLVGSARYLERTQEILTQSPLGVSSASDYENEELVVQLYERAAVKKIVRAARAVQREIKAGKPKDAAFNACLIDLVRASEAHCYLYAVHAFLQQVRAVEAGPLQAVLKKMFLLFCLNRVANDASTHLADGWMNEKQLELLQEKVRLLLSEIRKDAVPLVDSFNLPDSLVNSPLGRFDGDLYKHYFAEVRAAPNAEIKAPYWDELVKPCLRKDL